MSAHEIYRSEVTAVGEMASEFAAAGMIVLFGEDAPEELHDVAVLHRHPDTEFELSAGDLVELDGEAFPVTGVGDVASANFSSLGHVVVKFNGLTHTELPGDLSLAPGDVPTVKPGTVIRVLRQET